MRLLTNAKKFNILYINVPNRWLRKTKIQVRNSKIGQNTDF
jgi:hypothetical protein